MSKSHEQSNNTELQSAHIVYSGSGPFYYGSSSAPIPNSPVSGSNLPNRYPHFVGRQDKIQEVMAILAPASRYWIAGIDGMGGIGKTTLALEVAHQCKEEVFFTGYIWTSARDKPGFSLEDVTREIFYVLSSIEEIRSQHALSDKRSYAISLLAAKPRLLIIDNLESVEDEAVYKFIKDVPAPSKVLITSRLSTQRIQAGEEIITLGGLPEDDAVELLRCEANRLKIPIKVHHTVQLRIIARKSFGIPFVLRWIMERVREGKSLEWIIESLEHASANDIFDYIFKHALSMLDPQTRNIFRSMALLPTWARLETIASMNPDITAVLDRISELVKYSLVEDNRNLVERDRRYRLHPFTQYLAKKEFTETEDQGARAVEMLLSHYLNTLVNFEPDSSPVKEYLDAEFINMSSAVQFAIGLEYTPLLNSCILLSQTVSKLDPMSERSLFGDLSQRSPLSRLIYNPYSFGNPATTMFFGRHRVLRFIRESIEGSRRASLISLTGPRRIGKTSILWRLNNEGSNKSIYVLIDLQAEYFSLKVITDLLFIMARSAARAIASQKLYPDLDLEYPEQGYFTSNPFQAFQEYIKYINSVLGKARLIFLIDEFDILLRLTSDSLGFYALLRYMLQEEAFYMITAGTIPLDVVARSDSPDISPFYNIATVIRLSFLSRSEAVDLIRQPVKGILDYRAEAIDYLLLLSGCHPFLLQVLCFSVIEVCKEKGVFYVDLDTVESALVRAYEQLPQFFEHLIKPFTEQEQQLLSAAATIQEREGIIAEEKLPGILKRRRRTKLGDSLQKFLQAEILSKVSSGHYEFTMEMLRRWLLQKDSPELEVERSVPPAKQNLAPEREIISMDTDDKRQDRQIVTTTTNIGTAGIVHSGSGPIYSNAPFSVGNTISTKDEFLAALVALKKELEEARNRGLPEDTFVDAVTEVQAAELEAGRETPKSNRIVKRLESAKSLLTTGTGVAAAAAAGIEASNRLIALIEPLLQHASKLFS